MAAIEAELSNDPFADPAAMKAFRSGRVDHPGFERLLDALLPLLHEGHREYLDYDDFDAVCDAVAVASETGEARWEDVWASREGAAALGAMREDVDLQYVWQSIQHHQRWDHDVFGVRLQDHSLLVVGPDAWPRFTRAIHAMSFDRPPRGLLRAIEQVPDGHGAVLTLR